MLKLEYKEYTLDFKFEAGTSRGILTRHHIVLLKVYDSAKSGVFGLGEAAPLQNLSPDTVEEVLEAMKELQEALRGTPLPAGEEEVYQLVGRLVSKELPSLKFGLEMALMDLINGGKRLLFDNAFSQGVKDIPINGLVWMGTPEFMKRQIEEKLAAGFKCIKVKIGAIDFEKELELLEMLRDVSDELMIRVDANGAFPTSEVFKKLSDLAPFQLHSIEQPIMAGQIEAMQLICRRSPVPVALDEELIGPMDRSQKQELLKLIRPQYIILKPTLLGGFRETLEWISIADSMGIGWWLTSALESNLGLNAIAQFAGNFRNQGYQGLGTGQLYHNNLESPLELNGPFLGYNREKQWGTLF